MSNLVGWLSFQYAAQYEENARRENEEYRKGAIFNSTVGPLIKYTTDPIPGIRQRKTDPWHKCPFCGRSQNIDQHGPTCRACGGNLLAEGVR